MRNHNRTTLVLAALIGLLVAGCADDDANILVPRHTAERPIFERYVSLGNSITAGYQSAGINDSTQMQAYPVLLAEMLGVGERFHVPLLAAPGCPPPLSAPLTLGRIAEIPNDCAFRITPAPPYISNLAVPGATIASATGLAAAANPLTTFILGGQTQAEAMRDAAPTFVTSWLGNNDALAAALAGDTTLLTSVADFEAELSELSAQIEATPAGKGGAVVLLGVVNPVAIPALQPGVFAYLVKQNPQTAPLLPKPVNDNCAPVTADGTPNPLAFNLVSLQVLTSAVPEISCANDAPYVLTPEEQQTISARVTTFNGLIAGTAGVTGWIDIYPGYLLAQSLGDPELIRKCQGLAAALPTGDPQVISNAVYSTCPYPDPRFGFGSLFSYDGVHPSLAGHQLIADALYEVLDERYSFTIDGGFVFDRATESP